MVNAVDGSTHLGQRIGDGLPDQEDDAGPPGGESDDGEHDGGPVDGAVDVGQHPGESSGVHGEQSDHRHRRTHRPHGEQPDADAVHHVVGREVLEDDDRQRSRGAFDEQVGQTGARHAGERERHRDAGDGCDGEVVGDQHVEQCRTEPGGDGGQQLESRDALHGASTRMVGWPATDKPLQLGGPEDEQPEQQVDEKPGDDRADDGREVGGRRGSRRR